MKRISQVLLLSVVFVLFMTCSDYHVVFATDRANGNRTITSPYKYPICVESKEWNMMDPCEKRAACSIPAELIDKFTTNALLLSVLDYPFICDIEMYSSLDEGIAALQNSFPPLGVLLERDDVIDTLTEYLTTFQQEERTDTDIYSIRRCIAEDIYNYLLQQQQDADVVFPLNTRAYVYTPNNSSVFVYSNLTYADHGTTMAEVQAYNSQQVLVYGVNMKNHGSPSYNCHSHAWYSTIPQNPYWMDNPGAYMTDFSYLAHVTPQVGDIVTYKDNNNYSLIHSGIIVSVSPTIMVQSKWGCAGLFIHALGNCPYWNNGAQICQFWGLNNGISPTKGGDDDITSKVEEKEIVLNSLSVLASNAASGSDSYVVTDIREKFPFYCDYSTEKGLSILVYQMAENDYTYSLVPDKQDPVDFYPYDRGATLTALQIKELLSFYNLKAEEIVLHYSPCLISSYFGSRQVDESVRAIFDYKYEVGENVSRFTILEPGVR